MTGVPERYEGYRRGLLSVSSFAMFDAMRSTSLAYRFFEDERRPGKRSDWRRGILAESAVGTKNNVGRPILRIVVEVELFDQNIFPL